MHDPNTHQHRVRPAAIVTPSLLRASVAQRMVIAAGFAIVLWVAVGWALDLWNVGAAQ
jgi:hypothetical protein